MRKCGTLRQHRTINGYRLCRTLACVFSVILHKFRLTGVSLPALNLYNLTKNLTALQDSLSAIDKKQQLEKYMQTTEVRIAGMQKQLEQEAAAAVQRQEALQKLEAEVNEAQKGEVELAQMQTERQQLSARQREQSDFSSQYPPLPPPAAVPFRQE